MESQTALVSSSPATGLLPASLALFKQDESRLCLDQKTRDLPPAPEGRSASQGSDFKANCSPAFRSSDSYKLETIGTPSSQNQR